MTKLDNVLVEILSFTMLGRWGTEGLARLQDNAFIEKGQHLDSLQSVIIPFPAQPAESVYTDNCECTATGAMKQLDLYDQRLIDDGTLIGSVFDSFNANLIAVGIMNVVIYLMIYYSLKGKDRI